VKNRHFHDGYVLHTLGWPLDSHTYGGGFVYHFNGNCVSLGLVVGLDYRNPFLNPYQEFQRYKTHPFIMRFLEGGECIAYGARALTEGGWQSIPRLDFPGGALIGCAGGFMNVPKIKGSHTAMKSGMIAAECLVQEYNADASGGTSIDMSPYNEALRNSWIGEELWSVRNIRPAFSHFGFWGGLAHAGIVTFLTKGKEPWTLRHGPPDYAALEAASKHTPIKYDRPDGILTFSLLDNLARTNVMHEEDQPCHLQLHNPSIQPSINYAKFGGPEDKFCPAGVYEYLEEDGGVRFQINAQNCIHCKTCDIKDPSQNINWTSPEGAGGPKYTIT
jgi:electron-transferring-flavoprotein dehydrogenase